MAVTINSTPADIEIEVNERTSVIDVLVENYSFGAQGPQGIAGGIMNWEGAWVTSTSYAVDDAIEHNGSSYICRIAHTSGASTEPGIGGSWDTNWDLFAQKGAQGFQGATHTQNTDTGTTNTSFHIDSDNSGPLLKNSSGVLHVRNSGDTDYADLVVENLTVTGTTTTVNSETVTIDDNILVLNSNYTLSSPTENGGLEIERGTLTNASLIWDESNDVWKAGLAGSEITVLTTSTVWNTWILTNWTVTYVSTLTGPTRYTATTPGDVTTMIGKGTKVKLTHSSTSKYFDVVDTPTFGSGVTTITLQAGSDYSLAAGAITDFQISNGRPADFPNVFNFIPVFTADTSDPVLNNATYFATYSLNGTNCQVHVAVTWGNTSTYGGARWRLRYPVIPHIDISTTFDFTVGSSRAYDSSATAAYPGIPISWTNNNGFSIFRSGVEGISGSTNSYFGSTQPFTWTTSDILTLGLNYTI